MADDEKTELTEDKQRPEHLWKPGQSGNPAGRPKGSRSFTTKVKEALEKIAEGKEYTYEEAFIKAILKKAIVDQDTGMMKTVWEQLDGKPLQRIGGENTGDPIKIEISEKIANKLYDTPSNTSADS